MSTLAENINPKKNPVTSFFGILFLTISLVMVCLKYIVPSFVVLKQEAPFEGWHILVVVFLGLLLFFMNDNYFGRIFNRVDKISARRTETSDSIVDEIKIEKKKDV